VYGRPGLDRHRHALLLVPPGIPAHLGTVYRDKRDLVSDDINLLYRMLDAKPLKTGLERTGAGLALVISADVYDALVRRRPRPSRPDPPAARSLRDRPEARAARTSP
jgi:hypothetical protein